MKAYKIFDTNKGADGFGRWITEYTEADTPLKAVEKYYTNVVREYDACRSKGHIVVYGERASYVYSGAIK